MKYIHVALMAGLLSGCIDSGSDEPSTGAGNENSEGAYSGGEPTLSGLFKDTKTTGLDYKVGQYTGRTDELGAFKYFSEDDDITFSVGGVVLGTVKVSQVLTPIDLFVDGTSEKIDVQNIVSFLLALDADGDASNGIQISEAKAEEAKSWNQLDFSNEDFATEVINGVSTDLILPTSAEARAHIEATYNCMYSGLWNGQYGGTDIDEGIFFSFAGIVTAQSFTATYSTKVPLAKISTSSRPISYKNEVLVVTGDVSTGTNFTAEFPNITEAVGTWGSGVGTLSSSRFNKDLTYQNRITAILSDSEVGFSQDTNYYISADLKDSGEYKLSIQTFNEEVVSEYQVSDRVADLYEFSGTLVADETTVELNGINKKIKINTDLDINTISLLDSNDTVIDTASGGSCKLL